MYKKGENIPHADILNRFLNSDVTLTANAENTICTVYVLDLPLTALKPQKKILICLQSVSLYTKGILLK